MLNSFPRFLASA